MPELNPLPCPACNNAETITHCASIAGRMMWFVECADDNCAHHGKACSTESAAITSWNSLPRALRRTATPPTEDGQYYWALGMNLMWFVVRVVEINGGMYAMMPGSEVECPMSDFIEWAGPIAPPTEQK